MYGSQTKGISVQCVCLLQFVNSSVLATQLSGKPEADTYTHSTMIHTTCSAGLLSTSHCHIAPNSVAAHLQQHSHWQSFSECFWPLVVVVGMRYSFVVPITEVIGTDRSHSTCWRHQSLNLHLLWLQQGQRPGPYINFFSRGGNQHSSRLSSQ